MALATLSIDLEAKLARLEQGLNRAVQISEQQAGRMQAAFSAAQGAATLLAGAGAAALAAIQARQAIDTLDFLDDLAEKYGIAADKLSAYRYASEVAGTPTEELAKGLRKLAQGAAEGNRGLQLMGIQTRDAAGDLRSVDDLLLDVAERFASYRDSGAKAALAVETLGKSGEALIPFLNKGRDGIRELTDEAGRMGAVFGNEAAAKAGEFNDNLKRLELGVEAFRARVVSGALPAMAQFTGEMTKAIEQGSLLDALWKRMKGNAALDTLSFDRKAAEMASVELQRATQLVEQFNTAVARDPYNPHYRRDLEWARRNYDELAKAAAAANDKLKQTAQLMNPVAPPGQVDTRQIPAAAKVDAPSIDKEAESASKRRDEAFQKYLLKLRTQQEVVNAELSIGEKLQESDRTRILLLSELGDKTIGYTETQKALGQAEVERLVSAQQALRLLGETAAARKAAAAIEAQQLAARQRENESLVIQSQALREQIEEYGLSAEKVEELRIKRLEHTRALELENLLMLQNAGASAAEVSEAERTLRLLDQQIARRRELQAVQQRERTDGAGGLVKGLDEYLQKIQELGSATRSASRQALDSLEDDLAGGLAKGRLDVSRTVDFIVQEFLRLQVVRPLLNNLFGDGGGASLLSAAAKFFGFANGGTFGDGSVTRFATGGVFDSPHFFRFANGGAMATGVLGEAGPEAVMPLHRGPDGKLGVRAAGGGRSVVVNLNQYNTIGAGVSRQEVAAAMKQAERQAQAAVYEAARRGFSPEDAQ